MATFRLVTAFADAYTRRFRKVLEHIDAHLDEDLSVERLSSIARCSKFHFHRQFSELLGVSVGKYVQLVRLRRASRQLAFRDELRIIDIALASGYESHEAFTRAFRRELGQTPSAFREQPEWAPWNQAYRPVQELRSQYMKIDHQLEDVSIVQFESTRVALLKHRGDPHRLMESVRKFIDWRKQHRLPPQRSATFNLIYDDPLSTPAEEFRFDLCCAITSPIDANPEGVEESTIPGGRCARLHYVGPDDGMGEAIRFLYATWLPQSGEEPRDFPLFLQRVRFAPEVPEHLSEIDFYLPIV